MTDIYICKKSRGPVQALNIRGARAPQATEESARARARTRARAGRGTGRPGPTGGTQRRRRSVATTPSRPERMPTQRGGAPPSAQGRARCGPTGRGERLDRGGGAQSRGRRGGPQGRAIGPLRIALRANTRHRCEAQRRRTAFGWVTGQGRGSDGIAARSYLLCACGDTVAGRPSPSGGARTRPSEAAGA